jgi:hypothetical protein
MGSRLYLTLPLLTKERDSMRVRNSRQEVLMENPEGSKK